MKQPCTLLTGLALCGLLATPAFASEGSMYGGPVGGTDIGNAYLPPVPGFYMATLIGGGNSSALYGNNGRTNVDTSAVAGGAAAALLYVYPFHLLGGTLASSVEEAYWRGTIDIAGKRDDYSGFGDIYSDLLSWSRYLGPIGTPDASGRPLPPLPYGFTVKLAYSMIFPSGAYDASKFNSSGHNVYFFIPNFAVTYLTQPNFLGDGLEISAHVFLDFASYNHVTHYSSGPVGDVDFAVTERMGRWQAGLAGYYARQWDDDVQDGEVVQPGGKKLLAMGLGPVIAYDIPQWKANIKLKVTFPVMTRNTLGITDWYLIFSKAI